MNAPADPPEVWCVCVVAAGDGPPIKQRMCRLLKTARRCGLRCVGYPDPLPPGVTLVVLKEESDDGR